MTTNPFATALGSAISNNSEQKITITKHHLKKEKKMQSVSITIRNATAYIPSMANTPDGYNVFVNPVYSSKIELNSLTHICEETLNKYQTDISEEAAKKIYQGKKPNDTPILQATGSSSYRDLEKNSIVYSIQRYEDDWLLFIPGKTKKDDSVRLVFPQTTPVKELVQIIVDDYWQKRRNEQ